MMRYVLSLICLSSPLAAQQVTQDDVLRAELRPGWRSESGQQFAALHLQLAPHWKTYWRAPGDAGVAPIFDWSGSENVGAVQIHWPRPEVFDFQGMQTIGYRGDVVLPVEITPKDPQRPVRLQAGVELGVCNDICMPAALSLAGLLPMTGAPDGMISDAMAAVPADAAQAGLTRVGCRVEDIQDGLRVTARLAIPPAPGHETVVMETDGPVWVSDSAVSREGSDLIAMADFVPQPGHAFTFDPARLRLTILSPGQALEVTGCPIN